MKTVIALVTVILLTYLLFYYIYNDTVHWKGFLIRRGKYKSTDYLDQSAAILEEIHTRILKLISHLEKKYPNDSFVTTLKSHYSKGSLSEAAVDSRYTTFTIDKQDIHICLRTRDTHETPYDTNLLMYVMLHELAHMANSEYYYDERAQHGPRFKHLFKTLTQESINIGIYQYENYSQAPKEYCGITINSSIV